MIYLIPFIAVYFVMFTGIPEQLQFTLLPYWNNNGLPKRIKPLDCEHCLSFWLTILFGYTFTSLTFEVPIIAGLNAITAIVLYRFLNFWK